MMNPKLCAAAVSDMCLVLSLSKVAAATYERMGATTPEGNKMHSLSRCFKIKQQSQSPDEAPIMKRARISRANLCREKIFLIFLNILMLQY